MVVFGRGRDQGPVVGFTGDGRRPPPFMRRREVYIVAFLILLAWLVIDHLPNGAPPETASHPSEQAERIGPMTPPDLSRVAFVPEPLDEEGQTTLAWLLEHPQLVADNMPRVDDFALQWWEAQIQRDVSRRPLSQHFDADDLLLGSIPAGTPLLTSGILVDIMEDAAGHSWLSVMLRPDRYVLVVSRAVAETVVVGDPVRVAGRFLGQRQVAQGELWSVIGARTVIPEPEEHDVTALLGLGVLPEIGQDGQIPDESDIFEDIDDILPVLEKRPYYWLLGVVSRSDAYHENAYDAAPPAVAHLAAMHEDPDAFRGQPFVIRGTVQYAWEDAMVARDRPFGIERVLRIVLGATVWGPYEERDLSGRVNVRNTWVHHAIEVAVISDQALPKEGAYLELEGRFLKVHGVPAQANRDLDAVRGVQRRSEAVYFKFFVCGPYRDRSQAPIDWSPLQWFFLISVTLIGVVTVFLVRSDERHGARRPAVVRRLRRSRHRLGLDRAEPAGSDPSDV